MIVKKVAWFILRIKGVQNCNLPQANRKYNKHCTFCFITLFPNDPKSFKARTSKELKVVIRILNKYPNCKYSKPFYVDLEGGCCETERRIDFKKRIN